MSPRDPRLDIDAQFPGQGKHFFGFGVGNDTRPLIIGFVSLLAESIKQVDFVRRQGQRKLQ